MGKNGEESMLENIKQIQDVQFLILNKDENLMYQESEKINQYIRDNFDFIGTIEQFEIYEK